MVRTSPLHQRTHSSDKPYKCEFCNKSFTQNGSLNRHKLNNHNIMTKRQWQNRRLIEMPTMQESGTIFPKHEGPFAVNGLSPVSIASPHPAHFGEARVLTAAVPSTVGQLPTAYGDMSHIARYMQAYQSATHGAMDYSTPENLSINAASDTWTPLKSSTFCNDSENNEIDKNGETGSRDSRDVDSRRHSIQSPSSIPENLHVSSPPVSSTAKESGEHSPAYSNSKESNFDQVDNEPEMDDAPRRPERPESNSSPSPEMKKEPMAENMFVEYPTEILSNSSRTDNCSERFNSSQSAESGYLSPQTVTDPDDNCAMNDLPPPQLRTLSSLPRITDPIKRLGNKSRSASREKLSLNETISRLSGRCVDSIHNSQAMKALSEYSSLELLAHLQLRGRAHHCEHCQIFFLDAAMYFLHRGMHDPHHPFKCSLCGFQSRDKYDFSSHFLEHSK